MYNVNGENIVESSDVNVSQDFASIFRPIYYFSRVFGMLPFSIIYDSNGEVQEPKVRTFDVLWFVGSISLRLSIAFISIQQVKLDPGAPHVLTLGGFVLIILSHVFGAVAAGMEMCNRYIIIDILKMVNTFDKEASRIFNISIIFTFHSICCVLNTDIQLRNSFQLQTWIQACLVILLWVNGSVHIIEFMLTFHHLSWGLSIRDCLLFCIFVSTRFCIYFVISVIHCSIAEPSRTIH